MAKRRFQYIPETLWPYLGPAFKGINEDLNSLEASGGGGGGGGVTSWNDLNDKPVLSTVATSGAYADLTGRPSIPDVSGLAPKANPTFTGTVSGITKAMVGLGNVDNVSDAMKSFAGTQITTGQIHPARLGTGTRDGSKILFDDGTWKTPPTGGGGSFPAGGDVTITQNQDGSWPTITRVAGVHYRWLCAYDVTKWPTPTNGAQAGDELVGPDSTVVPA